MSNVMSGKAHRAGILGYGPESKASGTLDEDVVVTLFNVTGGQVLITALWAVVTTGITVANTVTVQANPTTGDTAVFVTGDLGTTDTAAGTVLGGCKQADGATDWQRNGPPIEAVVSTGTVELDSAGTSVDGEMTVYCTWVPLTPGASLEAA